MSSRLVFAWFFATAIATSAQSRFVTMTVSPDKLSDQVVVALGESAEVVSMFRDRDIGPWLYVKAGALGATNYLSSISSASTDDDFRKVIAGPAVIGLYTTTNNPVGGSRGAIAFCTVEIRPQGFPPGKTIAVPVESGGATITVEASTDLIQWTESKPGPYTNPPANLFFRIRGGRLGESEIPSR